MTRAIRRLACSAAVFAFSVSTAQALAGSTRAGSARVGVPQVAAPISVTQGKVIPDCGNGKSCGWPELLVTISFTSRVAVTQEKTWYRVQLQFTPTAPCSHGHNDGLAAQKTGVGAGERVHFTIGISDCPGIVRGEVAYNGQGVPNTHRPVPAVGGFAGLLVGTFSFHMR
jgi:hypothetical protein